MKKCRVIVKVVRAPIPMSLPARYPYVHASTRNPALVVPAPHVEQKKTVEQIRLLLVFRFVCKAHDVLCLDTRSNRLRRHDRRQPQRFDGQAVSDAVRFFSFRF